MPRNVQWSWSAKSDDGRTVVVTLWQDHFSGKIYREPPYLEHIRQRPGFNELMENLAWARDRCDGRFKVIVAIAKDQKADPRTISECFPAKMTMRLTEFDNTTGAFIAEAEGL